MSDEKQLSEILRESGFDIDSASGEWYYGNLYFGDALSAHAYLRAMQRIADLMGRVIELEAGLKETAHSLMSAAMNDNLSYLGLCAEIAKLAENALEIAKGTSNEH